MCTYVCTTSIPCIMYGLLHICMDYAPSIPCIMYGLLHICMYYVPSIPCIMLGRYIRWRVTLCVGRVKSCPRCMIFFRAHLLQNKARQPGFTLLGAKKKEILENSNIPDGTLKVLRNATNLRKESCDIRMRRSNDVDVPRYMLHLSRSQLKKSPVG